MLKPQSGRPQPDVWGFRIVAICQFGKLFGDVERSTKASSKLHRVFHLIITNAEITFFAPTSTPAIFHFEALSGIIITDDGDGMITFERTRSILVDTTGIAHEISVHGKSDIDETVILKGAFNRVDIRGGCPGSNLVLASSGSRASAFDGFVRASGFIGYAIVFQQILVQ